MTDTTEDQASTTMVHLAGPVLQFDTIVRQRCAWCGYVLTDDDLSMMSAPLNEDGSPPDLVRGWPEMAWIEVTQGAGGGFRGGWVVDREQEEDGTIKVPPNSCMRLPRELTGEQA